jgi:alkylresorcinol/alkylpyrone synthase
MQILSVGTALPPHRYEQDRLAAAFIDHWARQHHNSERVARFHTAVQVGTRHTALPIERYPALGFGEANAAFIEVGTDIGAAAVSSALERSGLSAADVDAIFFTTVTGIATPSIDARLCNRLGFRDDIRRTPMFGLGCVAGAAGVARMHDYLRAYPDQVAVLLSVELCSLTLQRGDVGVANLIATSLFGDGAACVVAVGMDHPAASGNHGPRVRSSRSRFYRDTERVMGWDISDTGMQIVLSASVPEVVQSYIRADVDRFLGDQGRSVADVRSWVCHPGGPKVLEAFESCLGLERADLQRTWDSLEAVGNLSSASVLFVLRDTIDDPPPPGTLGMMIAMGPGFCSEMVLLEW